MTWRLRFAEPRDAAAIASIYAPHCEGGLASFEMVAPTVTEIQSRVAKHAATHPWLVAEIDGAVVGYAYAGPHRERAGYRWTVETSIYVASGQHGLGVGTAAYGALLDLVRRQGFRLALAGITLPNRRSVGLHQRMGFRPAGVLPGVGFKHGAWHDVGWWTLELAPGSSAPVEPLDIGSLRKRMNVDAVLATFTPSK
ncbi:MAG: N-acetyltransferase [Phycisphaerales bacterium]|nr:N-acetyltransferase [Phycisphaerales bacterium]